MSDTPRTQKHIADCEGLSWSDAIDAHVEFASQLERELTAATKKAVILERGVKAMQTEAGRNIDEIEGLRNLIAALREAATRKPEPLSAPTHDGNWWVNLGTGWETCIVSYPNFDTFMLSGSNAWKRTDISKKWLPNPAPEVVG